MRMSCNGCRILRKGCSDTCILRPCLEWIKSPESQANATLFLAKFYGRAGLLNLINAGPEHLRPAIFRSLLYEACGRIVNPIYGSAGLLWSAGWQHCHDAVEAVLNGSPIAQAAPDSSGVSSDPVKVGDIRHVSKEESTATQELHRVKTRGRFKPRKRRHSAPAEAAGPDGSSLSHHSQPNAEAELVSQTDLDSRADGAEIELILRLGDVGPEPHAKILDEVDVPGADTCNLELELRLAGS